MENYDLDFMRETFAKHAMQWDKEFKSMQDSFLKSNPDSELPEHLSDDFSLAWALHSICCELTLLKYKLASDDLPA